MKWTDPHLHRTDLTLFTGLCTNVVTISKKSERDRIVSQRFSITRNANGKGDDMTMIFPPFFADCRLGFVIYVEFSSRFSST